MDTTLQPRRWVPAVGHAILLLPLNPDRPSSSEFHYVKSVVFEQYHPVLGTVRYDMIWQLAPAFAALTPDANVVGVRWDNGSPSGHGGSFSWGRARYQNRGAVWEVLVGPRHVESLVLSAEAEPVAPAAPPRPPGAEGAL